MVNWLQGEHWDVYQEVSLGPYDRIVDIVAVRDPVVMCVECKTSLSMAVIGQSFALTGIAHFICVATRQIAGREGYGRTYANRCMRRDGIGHFEVGGLGDVWQSLRPSMTRKLSRPVRDLLMPEHQKYAKAGAKGGGYFTPFKRTCEEVRKWVAKNPGRTMKEAVNGIPHHYASDKSAVASLLARLRQGLVPGIVATRNGRRLELTPAESSPALEPCG